MGLIDLDEKRKRGAAACGAFQDDLEFILPQDRTTGVIVKKRPEDAVGVAVEHRQLPFIQQGISPVSFGLPLYWKKWHQLG